MSLISRTFLRPRPQELGKIKIGGKGDLRNAGKDNEFRLPVKYDHFVVTTRVRGDNENFARDEEIHAKIGDRPMELRGVLMFERVEENFHSEMCQYAGRTKVISCDGVAAQNLKSGESFECPAVEGKPCPSHGSGSKGCKPYSRLHVQLWDSPHTGGYHVYRTTAWESTNNIQTALEEIFSLFGTLYQAPVKLVLYPAEDTYQDGNQTKTSKSYKVGLVLAMSREEAGRAMVDAKRQLEVTRNQLQLAAGEVAQEQAARDAEEAADIADEFHPPENGPAVAGTGQVLDDLKAELGATVEAETEEDGPDVSEPEPLPNEDAPAAPGEARAEARATDSLKAQLCSLRDRGRAADIPGFMALEEQAQTALEDGGHALVEAAIKEISFAFVSAKAEKITATDGEG